METNHNDLLEKVRVSFQKQFSDSIRNIEDLANTVDAVRLFVAVFANMCFGPSEHMTETTYGTVPVKIELLSYYLYPFFGISDNKDLTPFHVNACMDALDKLHVAYTWSTGFNYESEKRDTPIEGIASMLRMRALIIRGSAYPEQTRDEIVSIQGMFENY